MPLPIDPLLPEVVHAVRNQGAVVVVAPTGSGKTTRIPAALLDAGLRRVVMVQPRRVAARMAARRIAQERGGRLGDEVGYQVRFERRLSEQTRLEVVTEGVLTRRLVADPFLEGVDAVVLDEFHERSLDGDLALALAQEVRALGGRLAIVVMSATLDPEPVAAFLGGCPVVRGEGRTFPVEVRYDKRPADWPSDRVAGAVRDLVAGGVTGHVLAFLPGAGEIERAARALEGLPVFALHGSLRPEQQDAALAPSATQKIVLATNIAETSVTLEGVGAVVDSGEARVASFDPGLGLVRLERTRISAASADQRAGRAGRTGPGVCHRLWTEAEQRLLRPTEVPEVHRADLAETCLLLLSWGTTPASLPWYERPPAAALERAMRLLETLGAVQGGVLTDRGRALARLPVHPRLGTVLVEGHRGGFLTTAATAAALMEERDPFQPDALPPAEDDVQARLHALTLGLGHRAHRQRVEAVRDQLVAMARAVLGAPATDREPEPRALAAALVRGFPDRVARLGSGRRYRLAEGGGAELHELSRARGAPLLVAVAVRAGARGERQQASIDVAVPLTIEDLPVSTRQVLRFDEQGERVVQVVQRAYGGLVVDEKPSHEPPDPVAVAGLLADAASRTPDRALNRDDAVVQWLARLALMREAVPELELPDLDPLGLLPELCQGRRSFKDLRSIDLVAELAGRLSWSQRQALQDEAPERLRVPSGANLPVDYRSGQPVLAARIQQCFGWPETPRIARGRVPVTLHLLAPNHRPAQITTDLHSFWNVTWPEVRKDLRGRYPKHAWPEDPSEAMPEDRPKRRG